MQSNVTYSTFPEILWLGQLLIPIPVSNSPCNSTFKTAPGSWNWWNIMGVLELSILLSEKQNYWFETKQKERNCIIMYIKINVNWKWIRPCESWGSEDFKTGILFKNWPNMKPMPSKTRKVEKRNIHSQFQQRVKERTKCPIFYLRNLHNSLHFSSNSTFRDTFKRRI